MLKITARDRIFTAVAVPVALVALYAFFVHRPAASRADAMKERLYEIGDADILHAERAQLEKRRQEADKRRQEAEAAEKDRLAAAATNELAAATAPADASARLRRIVALLGDAGEIRVSSTTLLGTGPSASPSSVLVKEALGGQSPCLWRFDLVADYGSVVRALRLLSERGLPVVVEGVSLEGAPRRAEGGSSGGAASRQWRMDVCL